MKYAEIGWFPNVIAKIEMKATRVKTRGKLRFVLSVICNLRLDFTDFRSPC